MNENDLLVFLYVANFALLVTESLGRIISIMNNGTQVK